MTSTAIISLIAVAIYSVITLYIGLGVGYNRKTVSSSRGYFLGGGTESVILFFTTLATCFSTWVFMGAPGSFYANGIAWVACAVWWMIQVFMCGYYAPRIWRLGQDHGFITPAEMYSSYYKSNRIGYLVGISMFLFTIPTLIAQNQGMGKALVTLSGGVLPYWGAALYCVVIVGIYVFFGGFRSQAWVDTVQGIFFMVVLWVSLFMVLFNPAVGGLSTMYQRLEAYNSALLKFGETAGWQFKYVIGFMMVQFLGGNVCAPYGIQRFFCAKSGRDLVKTFRTLGIMATFCVLMPLGLIGLSGNLFPYEYANNDSVLITIINNLSPFWGVLVTIAIMAAGMSTVSSNLISASSIVTVDFSNKFMKNASDTDKLRVGKIATLGLVLVSYIASLTNVPGIVILLNLAFAGYAMTYILMFGMFHWSKKTSEPAAFWGTFTAIAVLSVGYIVWRNPLGVHPGLWGIVLGFIVFFVVNSMTKPVDEEHRKSYFAGLAKTKTKDSTYIPE